MTLWKHSMSLMKRLTIQTRDAMVAVVVVVVAVLAVVGAMGMTMMVYY